MKTSSILILSAVAITFIAITAFNLHQKSIYTKGEWRKRFYGMEFIAMKNISQIDLPDADKFNLTIEKGEREGLYLYPESKDNLQWTQTNNHLKLEVNKKSKEGAPFRNQELVLVLKDLKYLKTRQYESIKFQKSYDAGDITIKGFKTGMLKLDIGNRSNVYLDELEIDTLNASIGEIKGDSRLSITKNNKFNTAVFDIPGESDLILLDPNITKTSYRLSDNATVTITGNALKIFK